jgi:hypothetical protein
VAALLAHPAFAQAVHHIRITENSSTSLSVTFDGSTTGITVLSLGPDQWSVTLPATLFVSEPPPSGWIEPENALNANELSISPGIGNTMSVFSDVALGAAFVPVPDNTFVLVGTDASFNPIFAAVHDLGDAAAVPDPGSTFALLFLSLIALLSISRFRPLKFT